MIKKKYLSELSSDEKNSITKLIADCIQYERLELSPPDINGTDAFIYIYCELPDSREPDSILIAYDMDDYYEITAFTAPSKRCRGFFSSLFEEFINEHIESSICFYTDGDSYDAFMTLTVYDCEYAGTEHLMKLDKRPVCKLDEKLILKVANRADLEALAKIHSLAFDIDEAASNSFLANAFDTGETIWSIYYGNDDDPAGLAITSDQGTETCLYGLAIKPPLQGNGIGKAASAALCCQNLTFPITLHVTEENLAAYNIYRKLGFKTDQELMEYWY